MEPSRGKIKSLEGGFLWVRIMGDKTFEHSITFCWGCFAGKMPASNIMYNLLWIHEDERRPRIVNPVEKIWMQQGLNL
jgi:hypothetical protein